MAGEAWQQEPEAKRSHFHCAQEAERVRKKCHKAINSLRTSPYYDSSRKAPCNKITSPSQTVCSNTCERETEVGEKKGDEGKKREEYATEHFWRAQGIQFKSSDFVSRIFSFRKI